MADLKALADAVIKGDQNTSVEITKAALAEGMAAKSVLDETIKMTQERGLVLLEGKAKDLLDGAHDSAGLTHGKKSGVYPDGLTEREVEVLRLVVRGLTNKEIGGDLFISVKTVNNHVRNILEKIGASNRTEAATYAMRSGLIVESE